MILGYVAIGVSLIILIALSIINPKWQVYAGGLFISSGLMIYSTVLANSQLVGTDIHTEYQMARSTILNGYDLSIKNAINACLPVSIVIPDLDYHNLSTLETGFKIFELIYVAVPVMLFMIYKSFMPLKLAFLASFVFIALPTYFLEMPQMVRAEVAQFLMVAAIGLILFKAKEDKYSYWLIGILSILIVLSHYSTALFWLLVLGVGIIFNPTGRKWLAVIFGVTVLAMAIWFKVTWQGVDIGNGLQDAITKNQGNYWIMIPATIILIQGIIKLLKSEIPQLFKGWIILASLLLVVALIWPGITNTINYTRYYQLAFIFLAPALIYLIPKPKILIPLIAVGFFVTSGLLFNLLRIDSIDRETIPYSIALENYRLDAGGYLTDNDQKVTEWANENLQGAIYTDFTGLCMLKQSQNPRYSPRLTQGKELSTSRYIYIRSWNQNKGYFAQWVGNGLKKFVKIPENIKTMPIIYQVGDSTIYENNATTAH